MKKQIHILNGPNLNLLGRRQPEIYGSRSFEAFFGELQGEYKEIGLFYFQSNHEGALLDYLHLHGFSADGFVFNAGAYTHTSIALADAIAAITSPVVEVHISDIYAREPFRHHSWMKAVCVESIVGKGLDGYKLAIDYLIALHADE